MLIYYCPIRTESCDKWYQTGHDMRKKNGIGSETNSFDRLSRFTGPAEKNNLIITGPVLSFRDEPRCRRADLAANASA